MDEIFLPDGWREGSKINRIEKQDEVNVNISLK